MTDSVVTPRVQVLADGAALPTPISALVTSNNYRHASEFALEFATASGDGAWWDASPPWVLDVQVSTDGESFMSLITGEVDQVEADLAAGTVLLTGRDFTAALIEARTQETFWNQTSAAIAQTLAARHNLDAAVADTTTLAGTFYQQDHTRLSLGAFARARTEWDILTWLAQHEGFDVWVAGRTLYFQPQAALGAADFTVSVGTGVGGGAVANVELLRGSRALTLAKDVQVEVHSWDSRQQRSFVRSARTHVTAGSAGPGGSQVGTGTQRYIFVRPNLTEDQALQLAQTTAEQITRQERHVEIEMPGELTLSPRSQVAITGTGTSFDQSYWVDSIHRQVSMAGFRQTLRLTNHSPQSVTFS